jgi:hypothetical protein
MQRAPPPVLIAVIGAEFGANTLFGDSAGEISYRPIKIGPQWSVQKDSSEEQLMFEERQKQLIQEAKAKIPSRLQGGREQQIHSTTGDRPGFAPTCYGYPQCK